MEDFDVTISFSDQDVSGTLEGDLDYSSVNNFSSMRFECNEMRRLVWNDMSKLEMGRSSLATVLHKIEKFQKIMTEKYKNILDNKNAFHAYTRLVMIVLIESIYVMVLSPYYSRLGYTF